jgi:CRISPR-associated protein Csd2
MEPIKNRYEFTVIFDVENGNPNGDPDAGNMPRIDPETSIGLVTDVCLKRKIRNFVEIYKEDEPGYNILIKEGKALNTKFAETYDHIGVDPKKKRNANEKAEVIKRAKEYMCKNYFDVRTFGAVMSTGKDEKCPCGTVRGAVQFSFAKSVDPIYPQELTITRQIQTKEKDREKNEGTMGRKSIVPYGLYRADGYVSAMLAQKLTKFSEEDLELLWNAIINMFEHDRSAARGKMCVRKLYVFKHDSLLGNAPANVLFDKIVIGKKDGVEVPRSFNDYEITVDENMPEGVELQEKA